MLKKQKVRVGETRNTKKYEKNEEKTTWKSQKWELVKEKIK
jgi:hypothetical protein